MSENKLLMKESENLVASKGKMRVMKPKINSRFPSEMKLLHDAINGDEDAANKVLHYLCSDNKDLRSMMKAAIHDMHEKKVWRYLLTAFSLERWQDVYEVINDFDKQTETEKNGLPVWCNEEWCQVARKSITEVFIVDESKEERLQKEELLHQVVNLDDKGTRELNDLRFGAAYFLGMRGDTSVIPVLDELINTGDVYWIDLAIQALAALHHEDSANPLLKALALTLETNQRKLHQKATTALNELGSLAEKTWLKALEHENSHIRWHAARALSRTGNISKLDILAKGLYDESHAVRWATANVLADLGSVAVPSILRALTTHPINEPFRQAAYHALHSMRPKALQEELKPLLDALHALGADIEAPMIAEKMLENWGNDKMD